MESYDITKVDIFSLKDLKRGELASVHSLLLFLYSKYHGNDEVSLKYSEVNWMNYNSVSKVLTRLHDLSLITIENKPTRQTPCIIKLKPNNELHYILGKDKVLEYHKFMPLRFTRSEFKEAMGCGTLYEHFLSRTVTTWIRNIRNRKWDLYKFLVIAKIVSYYSCDYKIKTFTINKYVSKKTSLNTTIKFLYDKVPANRKEVLYSQFENTLKGLGIKNDKSFNSMINKYLEYLRKEYNK